MNEREKEGRKERNKVTFITVMYTIDNVTVKA